MLKGDFGRSFYWQQPVSELIGERIALTATISFVTIILVYAIAIPIGIYSATHQYSVGDYAFTTLGFIGVATPNFLLALILMWLAFRYLGWNITGLFSTRFSDAPWSFAKVIDMLKHLPVPVLILATAGTASILRVFRGSLLDELRKQYVITARAKGASERSLLFKYPVRVALNPIVASIGGLLAFSTFRLSSDLYCAGASYDGTHAAECAVKTGHAVGSRFSVDVGGPRYHRRVYFGPAAGGH